MGFSLTIPANHPMLTFLNTAYSAGLTVTNPLVLSLGNIDDEDHDLECDLSEMPIPTGGSGDTLEYDTAGVTREITIDGNYAPATALLLSQWILTMEALQNFKGGASLYAPYVLAYTAGTFPTYPYTTWGGTTGRSLNVIVESFLWNRSSDTPAADLIYYTLKLKERAVSQ